MALVLLLWGCRANPPTDVSISPKSSLLAVDVLFPSPLSRDPSLVQAFFIKGPIPGGMQALPDLVPATFVKRSRAYLLDPEPGTYSLVAVTAAYAPPWNEDPIAGVTKTRASGTSSDAVILPLELIHRTRTTIAPGRVEFMGALRVRRGDRIDAHAAFQDDVQKQLAERIRPGVTSESGLAGWLKRTRMADPQETSLSNEPGDRKAFLAAALEDLGESPWAQVIARAASHEDTLATAAPPAPRPTRAVAIPESVAPEPQAATPEPLAPIREPQASPPVPELQAARPIPEPRRPPGIPPDSPLAEISLGMSRDDVRRILGPPDSTLDRFTAKAWIPFYSGPGASVRDWIYVGKGRVVFSRHDASFEVFDVVYQPEEGR